MNDLFWLGVVTGMFTLCMLDWLQDIIAEVRRSADRGGTES